MPGRPAGKSRLGAFLNIETGPRFNFQTGAWQFGPTGAHSACPGHLEILFVSPHVAIGRTAIVQAAIYFVWTHATIQGFLVASN